MTTTSATADVETYVCVYCDSILTTGACLSCNEIDGALTYSEWLDDVTDRAHMWSLTKLYAESRAARDAEDAVRVPGHQHTTDEYDLVADKAAIFGSVLRHRLADADKAVSA